MAKKYAHGTFIRLNDEMPDHPKVAGLSDAAFRALVEAWCWCNRTKSDGVIPTNVWTRRWSPKVLAELSAARLIDDPDGITMHDYLDHQQSREEIEYLSEVRSKSGKKGGRVKASAKANATANGQANAEQNGGNLQAEERREKRDKNTPAAAAAAARFDEFWNLYPRKVDKGHAVKAWKAATKKADPDTILAGLREQLPSIAIERRTDGDFRPHPATWLNGERWADEVDGAPPPDDPYAHIPLIRGGER